MKVSHSWLITLLFSSSLYSYDLPKKSVKSYDCTHCNDLSHEKLQSQWAIENKPVKALPINAQESVSYEQKISAKQLQEGVSVTIEAPGAVILLTPLQEKPLPNVDLYTQNQRPTLKQPFALQAHNEEISAALMAVPYQHIMQINPDLGAGTFILKTTEAITPSSDSYLLHVYDKFSSTSAKIQSDKLQYQYGDHFLASLSLTGSKKKILEKDVSAYLLSPHHDIVPLKVSQVGHNEFHIETTLNSESNPRGGNWYLEVDVWHKGHHELHRTVRNAFSYSIPSANILSIKKINTQPLTFVATIEVANASRYCLQSLLFQSNENPVELAQNAQWLEPGIQTIQFQFNNSQNLPENTLFLGQLQLIDYGQLKTIYQYNPLIRVEQL